MRDAIRWFKCKLKPPKNREVPFLHFMNSPHGPELFVHAAGVPNLEIGFAFREHWGYAGWFVTFFVQKRPSIALLELCMVVVAIDTLGPFMEGK